MVDHKHITGQPVQDPDVYADEDDDDDDDDNDDGEIVETKALCDAECLRS